MSNTDDQARDKQLELEQQAVDATQDTEDALNQLMAMQVSRRKDPGLERRYEEARNSLASQLAKEGPRWFLDEQGEKWLAHTKAPEKTTLDVELAEAYAKDGRIPQQTLDEIAPRAQSLNGLHAAIRSGRLTSAQVQALCSFRPGTPYVNFVRPVGSDDDE